MESTLYSKEGTTQGDPLAMYDDAAAGGSLKALREWWDHTLELGPAFGYYPNAVQTWIIVKEQHLDKAKDQFKDSEISITTEGKRHLGAAIGPS